MRVIFDTASILLHDLLGGKDPEGFEIPNPDPDKKPIWVNTWQYGYDKAMNNFVQYMQTLGATPSQCVFVFEGLSPLVGRNRQVSDYSKGRSARVEEIWKEYAKLRTEIERTFLDLGAQCCSQNNVEGDDVIGFIALNSEVPVVVASNDNDMSVLNGVNMRGAEVLVAVNHEFGKNKFGDWPTRYITIYKALVGDSSDNYGGIPNFGPKTFEKLVAAHGLPILDELDSLAQRNRVAEIGLGRCPILDKIAENYEAVQKCYRLAKIRIEDVNNPSLGFISWKVGMVKEEPEYADVRLKKYYCQAMLVDNDLFDEVYTDIANRLKNSPYVSLDVETATPPQSDEWLENQKKKDSDSTGIDVLGQELVSVQLTFGRNQQFTVYLPINNKDTANIPTEKVAKLVASIPKSVPLVIQNVSFELVVLKQAWGHLPEFANNGFEGFLPNVLCTKLLASYVDENASTGLKQNSKRYLDYDQISYADVTQGRKMSELTADEAFSYGCDDTITTAALFNHYKLICELENTWKVFKEVEIDPAYLTADAFIKGTPISMAKLNELRQDDLAKSAAAFPVLRQYLIENGWEGTVPPVYTCDNLPLAKIKEAYEIVTGKKLDTAIRTFSKIVKFISEIEGNEIFASALEQATTPEGAALFTKYVQQYFSGEPEFNIGSPVQMKKLFYDVMGLEQRVFNKPTDVQYAKARASGNYGRIQGTVKTDDLAVQYALKFDCEKRPELKPVLEALQVIKMVQTRESLYYQPYPNLVHWRGKNRIHSSFNQCATNTRRYTSSGPNLQQLPKHPKATGEPARFREVFVPHKKNAVVVSMDFAAQELRVIADYSRDENMLACYMGDSPKDMHLLTGLGIAQRKYPLFKEMSYDEFMGIYNDDSHELFKAVKLLRSLGKKVNFTTEYGAQAPKLAQTMLIDEAEAQIYIDARLEAFAQADEWKRKVVQVAKRQGYVTSKMGARRHLHDLFNSKEAGEASKAERQAVNYMIQGSSAEMTKLAMARMWKSRLFQRYDSLFIGVIHDEVVASCEISQLVPFLREMHKCMIAQFADMVVPVASSISIGLNFGEQIELGEVVDEDLVNKALESLGFCTVAA